MRRFAAGRCVDDLYVCRNTQIGAYMIKKEEFYFDSRDNMTKLHAIRWIPPQKPVAILQIVHGMAEYIDRYEEFATDMAKRGFLVVGNDHLGHGQSVPTGGTEGYFCENDPATVVVRDVHRLKKMTQSLYHGVPYFIMGHSMGSFITRNYLCKYGSGIDGAIILGTGMQPKSVLMASKAATAVQKAFCGSKHVSRFLDKNVFGNYNKRIENARTSVDWLTKDAGKIDAYLEDPRCGFVFTVNGFQTLFELIWRLYKKENLANMPKALPVMFAAGTDDPVGGYFKGVQKAVDSFIQAGMQDVTVKKYETDRHELLNETDREQIIEDIYQWIMKKVDAGEGNAKK